MDHILREAKERFSGGVKLEERNVQFLLFADDLMLVAEKEEDVERNLQKTQVHGLNKIWSERQMCLFTFLRASLSKMRRLSN